MTYKVKWYPDPSSPLLSKYMFCLIHHFPYLHHYETWSFTTTTISTFIANMSTIYWRLYRNGVLISERRYPNVSAVTCSSLNIWEKWKTLMFAFFDRAWMGGFLNRQHLSTAKNPYYSCRFRTCLYVNATHCSNAVLLKGPRPFESSSMEHAYIFRVRRERERERESQKDMMTALLHLYAIDISVPIRRLVIFSREERAPI